MHEGFSVISYLGGSRVNLTAGLGDLRGLEFAAMASGFRRPSV
jgi:hypothetical protein